MDIFVLWIIFFGGLLFILPFLIFNIFKRIRSIEQKLDDQYSLSADDVEKLKKLQVETRGIIPEKIEKIEKVAPSTASVPESPTQLKPEVIVEPTPEPAKPIPTMPSIPEPTPLSTEVKTSEPTVEVAPSVPVPQERELFGKKMSEEEWEAMVGGSVLNKLGVLILVIGLALFLGYSLKYFGPVGRISIGFVVSFTMLLAGVMLEHRSRYVMYGRGLIGGGWAALYFTTYAMHGLEAARVIDDPLTGMMLLGVVAAGMIIHSLRYRSEVVTGLAYIIGFITIVISPVLNFSIIASIPLAASLLVITYRFGWITMTVLGLVATYGVYALRYGTVVSPSDAFPFGFTSGQIILVIYWLLFEVFDMLDIRRRPRDVPLERTIFPLNLCGFVGVSLLYWPEAIAINFDVFFAATSGAYLLSTLVRARLRPLSSFPSDIKIPDRILSGSYEEAITVTAAFAVFAIFERFSGFQINIALLLEAEILFLSGMFFRQPYLRYLAGMVFILPVFKFGLVDVVEQLEQVSVAGMALRACTPIALLTTTILYLNRMWLLRVHNKDHPSLEQWGYSAAGTVILVVVLGYEIPLAYLAIGWLLLAYLLLEVGLRKQCEDLRFQSYVIAFIVLMAFIVINMAGMLATEQVSHWRTLAPGALIFYAVAVRFFRVSPGRIPEREKQEARDYSLMVGTALLASLFWYVLPSPLVAVGWGVLALVLIESGFSLSLPALRVHGNIVMALSFGHLFLANFTIMGETAGISHRLLTVIPVIYLFHYLSTRLREEREEEQRLQWEKKLAHLYFYVPALLAVILIRFEFGRGLAVVGWALLALGLLYYGVHNNNRDLRWQSYVISILTFFRCWATNFFIPEYFWALPGRFVTAIIVITSLFAASFLSPRQPERVPVEGNVLRRWAIQFDLHARSALALLAIILLSAFLFYEVPARFLTEAWALEGILLLVLGFPLRERVLRLSGLVLLLICILKVFLYDFRELDAIFRILSFIILGLLLLGASLLYTRFRERIRRYL